MELHATAARSWLFCPATRPERIPKAAASGADVVIVDLEDAVATAEKAGARAAALDAVRAGGASALRVNALGTPDGLRDLLALHDAGIAPAFLVVPKSESPGELDVVAASVPGAGLCPLIETARGLAAAERIALHPRVVALVLGGADLAADLGAAFAWEPLLYARTRLVAAAATGGVAAIDVPCLALDDAAALADETARVRRLGFTGKLAIHPRQVEAINAVFTPTADEIAHAGRVVAALAAAGGGVAVLDGTMIDAPLARAARRTLALGGRRGP